MTHMFDKHVVSTQFAGRELTLEAGEMARMHPNVYFDPIQGSPPEGVDDQVMYRIASISGDELRIRR